MPEVTHHTIVQGDSRQMNSIASNSVHLVVTSPPYWQLKDYGTEEQIGFNDSYEAYINHLNLTWKECYRVLKDGCRLCVNIGDQFARSSYYGRYKVIPIHAEIIKFCETIGFDFMGQIIWQKTTTMNTSGGGSIMGSYPHPRNGIVKLDFEYILLFKKPGNAPKPSKEQKENSIMSKEDWNTYFNGHWHFGGAKQDKHIAMFPEELPYRLIRMFSFPEETVLDPFMGSGTTASVARKLNRNSIGYEINKDFIPLIKSRIGDSDMLSQVEFTIIDESQFYIDFKKEIKRLPYQFIDTHKLDKQVDIKKNTYGSKVDKDTPQSKTKYFSIKEIISPELLTLNNGTTIRLIGVKENPKLNKEAIEFLKKKLKRGQVFLKFDKEEYDHNKNLCVYLYLKNKTFINAHLFKNKLVDLDETIDFKHKNKFKNLYNG